MEKATFVQKVVIKHPSDNKFLILVRNMNDKSRPGDFDIPGGSLKDGELHEEALRREVKEETGLEITNINPVVVNTNYDANENKYFVYIGYQSTATSTDVILNPEEHSSFIWMTAAEFESKAPKHILLEQVLKTFGK